MVARTLDCDQRQIYESVRGRQNLARTQVGHYAHRSGQMAYREIAEALGMNHYSAVASSTRHLNILCHENKHIRRLKKRIRQEMPPAQTPFFPFSKSIENSLIRTGFSTHPC